MKKEETLIKDNNGIIRISDSKVYSLNKEGGDKALLSVTITPGLHIALGNSVNNYIKAIAQTDLPVVIEKVMKDRYNVKRMPTGNVKGVTLANIACSDNSIYAITFNRDLNKDEEFRRYIQLSVLHQLSVPYETSDSKFIDIIKQVSNMQVIDAEVSDMSKTIKNIKLRIEDIDINYTFIVNSDTKLWELMCISL